MLIIFFLMLFCLLFSSLSQISGFGAAFPSFFQLLSLLLKIIVFFFLATTDYIVILVTALEEARPQSLEPMREWLIAHCQSVASP